MTRTYVVTGAAKGIGQATVAALEAENHRVIGVGRSNTEVVADLATASGRAHMLERVEELTGGTVDGVIANAGVSTPGAGNVAVNYFGAVRTVELLRPLLTRSSAPRAAVVSSLAATEAVDDDLLAALRADDETAALAAASELGDTRGPGGGLLVYTSAKRALSLWIRRQAIGPDWAGAGIALNAVSPGIVRTPMTDGALDDPAVLEALQASHPAPYGGPAGPPEAVASLLAWLTSPANTFLTGQVIYVDGGTEAIKRPEAY